MEKNNNNVIRFTPKVANILEIDTNEFKWKISELIYEIIHEWIIDFLQENPNSNYEIKWNENINTSITDLWVEMHNIAGLIQNTLNQVDKDYGFELWIDEDYILDKIEESLYHYSDKVKQLINITVVKNNHKK